MRKPGSKTYWKVFFWEPIFRWKVWRSVFLLNYSAPAGMHIHLKSGMAVRSYPKPRFQTVVILSSNRENAWFAHGIEKEKAPELGLFCGCGGRTWTYDPRVMSSKKPVLYCFVWFNKVAKILRFSILSLFIVQDNNSTFHKVVEFLLNSEKGPWPWPGLALFLFGSYWLRL